MTQDVRKVLSELTVSRKVPQDMEKMPRKLKVSIKGYGKSDWQNNNFDVSDTTWSHDTKGWNCQNENLAKETAQSIWHNRLLGYTALASHIWTENH